MVALLKVVVVLAMSVTPLVKAASFAYCHFTTFPTFPDKLMASGLVFLQITVDVVLNVPAVVPAVTVTVCVTPVVVLLHSVSTLLTQYVVVVDGDTVMAEAVCPEIILEPIVDPVPHWKELVVPVVPPVAVNVVEVPLQTVVVPEIDVGAVEATLLLVNVKLKLASPLPSLTRISISEFESKDNEVTAPGQLPPPFHTEQYQICVPLRYTTVSSSQFCKVKV